jgi:5-methylcytosine-specific restriction endonuclease McrA
MRPNHPLLQSAQAELDPGQRRIYPLLRFAILDRDHFLCRYCGAEATEVDHVCPWTRGGPTLPFNLVAACRSCNRQKGERTPEEWRRALAVERLRRIVRCRRNRRGLSEASIPQARPFGRSR